MDQRKPPISPSESRLRRNHPSDGSSVAVYCRNEAEVREGFLTALRAMGIADIEQHPEPAQPVRDEEP
jgi:hypothetical protein